MSGFWVLTAIVHKELDKLIGCADKALSLAYVAVVVVGDTHILRVPGHIHHLQRQEPTGVSVSDIVSHNLQSQSFTSTV